MRPLWILMLTSVACTGAPSASPQSAPHVAASPPPAPANRVAEPANPAADHVPTFACVDAVPAQCDDAAACQARGRRVLREAQSCDWSTLCTTANEPCKSAFVAFQRACRTGNPRSCFELAELAPLDVSKLSGRPPDATEMRRRQLLEDACAMGYGRGCYRRGDDLYGTPEGDAWYRKSVPLYERACAANDGAECSLLAYDYLEARGVARDGARAADLLAKACDLGDGYGCDLLGQLLADGSDVTKDVAKARVRFQRGCELDPPYSGCFAIGKLTLNEGRGDVRKAVAWFHTGCPGGTVQFDCSACNALDDLCRRGVKDACGPQAARCR